MTQIIRKTRSEIAKNNWVLRRANHRDVAWNKIQDEDIPLSDITRLYYEEKRGTHFIAKELGYSQMQIIRWMRNAGLHRRSHSEKTKAEWSHKSYIRSQMKARNRTIENKSEKKLHVILDRLFPERFKWVGGGEKIIDGKCPDFIDESSKTIIELFGRYWHKEQEVETRVNHFQGYQTIVVWDTELKDEETLINRLTTLKL